MHLEMVKELYSQIKNIVEDSNVKLYKQKKIFTTFNMNSQITATGFHGQFLLNSKILL